MQKKFFTLLMSLSLVLGLSAPTLNAQGQKKAQSKPFLIQGKLPHLSRMVKVLWDDKDVALTDAQKEKLLKIRKETKTRAKALAKQINPLEAKIVKKSNEGATPESLKADVEKLASLRAKATMIHLHCIYNTRAVLSQDQLDIIE
jgi:hypothetical protein